MLDQTRLATSVKAAIAADQAWMLGALKRLVEAQSFSGHEEAAQKVMRELLDELGFEVREIPVEPEQLKRHPLYSPVVNELHGCHNLLGRLSGTPADGTGTGKSLMISGHVDVVPTGHLPLWQCGPFDTYVKDGWFYGRGAGDMKGGLIAALTGLKALVGAGFRPNRSKSTRLNSSHG